MSRQQVFYVAVAVCLSLFIGVNRLVTGAEPAMPQAAVKLQLLDYDGIQKLLASHQGKVIVMDCWSTSCAPCLEEFPKLVALHKQYGAEKLACVSLSFDYEGIGKPAEAEGPVLEFLSKQNATFDNILCSEESDVLYKKMKLNSIPAVYVYGRDGKLVKLFEGDKAYAGATALVAELMPEK